MLIDVSMYKVIYENIVYNAIGVCIVRLDETDDGHRDNIAGVDMMEVFAINENGQIISIRDEGKKFQFLPKIT